MRPSRFRLISVLAVLVAIFLALLMLGNTVRQMIYPAPSVRVPSPPPEPLVEVPLESADGTPLSAWWLPPPRPNAPSLLMLHGNGENLETMRRSGLFEELRGVGAGVLGLDYPGYGNSGGAPGEAANLAAAEAAWEWLRRQAPPGARVIVGWSLGAAVGVQLAASHADSVDGLVLMSAWDRLGEVAAIHFPRFLVSALLAERYDSAAAAERLRCPVLVVHGSRDSIVPMALGRALFAALPEPKRWVEVPRADHNDLLAHRQVWDALAEFLDQRSPAGSDGL
ncbi:MAG TPA: alpha/beta hydrolase [Thermoanaerobaculia bacterium]|nr:alpha/beta hydrolase [Thermoanaerobaculia bacterium]